VREPYCARQSSLDQGGREEVLVVVEKEEEEEEEEEEEGLERREEEDGGGKFGLFDQTEGALLELDEEEEEEEEDFLLIDLEDEEEEEEEAASASASAVAAVLAVRSVEAFSPLSAGAPSALRSASTSKPRPARPRSLCPCPSIPHPVNPHPSSPPTTTAAADDTVSGGPLPLSASKCDSNIPTTEITSRQAQAPSTRMTRPLRLSIPPCG